MTDNEKRAHDLAITSTNLIISARLNGAKISNEGDDVSSKEIDVYQIYKTAYERSLASFTRDFPEKP